MYLKTGMREPYAGFPFAKGIFVMIPNFTLLGKELSPYMIFALIGVLTTLFVCCRTAIKQKIDETNILSALLFSFGGGLIGAHLLYGALNYKLFFILIKNIGDLTSFDQLIKILSVIFGGGVWYGGFIVGALTGGIYLKKKGCLTPEYTDVSALASPLFHLFGRLGCFFSGCCFGVESPVGFVYHHCLIPEANGVSRFPVQLVEAFANLCIFLILFILLKKGKAKGQLFTLYLLTYPVCRFILEFFRGDTYRGIFYGLSTSQWISIVLFLFGLLRLFTFYRKKKKLSI